MTAIDARFGHQRIETAFAVALEPVTQGLGGDMGAGGTGNLIVLVRLFFETSVQPFGARRQVYKIGNEAVAKQGNLMTEVNIGVFHGHYLSVGLMNRFSREVTAATAAGLAPFAVGCVFWVHHRSKTGV